MHSEHANGYGKGMASRGQAGFDSTSRAKVQSKEPSPRNPARNPESVLDTVETAYAFFAARTALCTRSARCFFATMTTKRWKSVSDRLLAMEARRCANADFSHFSTMASFSRAFLMAPEPAARGSFVRRRGVRVRWR